MERSRLDTPEIKRLAIRLSAARTPNDLLTAINALRSDFYGMGAMVSLPTFEQDYHFYPFVYPSVLPAECIPYFYYPNIYCVHREPLHLPPCRPDWTIIFDSNFAGCVDRFVRGKSLNTLQEAVTRIIDVIIRQNLNFDYSFYTIENVKQVNPLLSKLKLTGIDTSAKLWESLDNGFKQNLISLQLFKDVDNHHYVMTGQFKSKISIESATDRAIKQAYWFYAGEGRELAEELLDHQRVILKLLLVIYSIQFESIANPNYKLGQLLNYIQEKFVYFDRETVIAHKYFKDPPTIPILATVNKGTQPNDLFKKLDNLAWDLTAPRYMESMMKWYPQPNQKYMVPFFLSLDEKLKEMIECYPIRLVIIDWHLRQLIPIPRQNSFEYFRREGCEEIMKDFNSVKKREQRSRRKRPASDMLLDMINDEFARLSSILANY